MIRRVVLGSLVLAALALTIGYLAFARSAIPAGLGLAAKHLCSLEYVSGLDREQARRIYVDPFVQPMSRFLDIRYHDSKQAVEARAFLRYRAWASHRPGLGCTVRHSDAELQPASVPHAATRPLPRSKPDATAAARLDAALDAAFADPDGTRNTLAVVVLHDGDLVAERYAPGVGADTALPGWSMTKSVTTTLVGLLVRDGRLDVDAPGAIREWRGSSDPRAAISLDQLLRMTAGLAIREDQTGADPNSEMLFRVPDGAAYSAQRPLQSEPGKRWEYMSGNTVLAARAVADALGGRLEDWSRFARERLFGPLGMATAVLEPDEAGTFIGSSFMLASARDWAKLGQLYLDGGRLRGEPRLPEDWVAYVTRHTAPSGKASYGAGWWINAAPEGLRWPSLPKDTFAAQGFQQQYIFVVPSERLVLVRLGATSGSSGAEELAAGVIEALSASRRDAERAARTSRVRIRRRPSQQHKETGPVILSNTETVPGKSITRFFGVVSGSTVRAKHIGRDILAGFKNIVGGELGAYTELLKEARSEAVARMVQEAESLGANAVVNVRFSTSSVAQGAAELFAYGTAVNVE